MPYPAQNTIIASGSGTNAAAVATLAAPSDGAYTDFRWCVSKVIVSYSAAPTGGNLTIVSGSNTLVNVDIAGSGPLVLDFDPPLRASVTTATGVGNSVVATLAAAGASVAGKVTLYGYIA